MARDPVLPRAEGVLRRSALLAAAGVVVVCCGATGWLDAHTVLHLAPGNQLLGRVGMVTERPGQRAVLYPMLLAAAAAEWAATRRARALVATGLTLALVNVLVGALKVATGRGTPRVYGPGLGLLPGTVGEFPSGQAANIVAAATLVVLLAPAAGQLRPVRWGRARARTWQLLVRVLPLLCPLVELTSWLRSTHWVSDLLVGGTCGAACAAAAVVLTGQALPGCRPVSPRPGRADRAADRTPP